MQQSQHRRAMERTDCVKKGINLFFWFILSSMTVLVYYCRFKAIFFDSFDSESIIIYNKAMLFTFYT